MRVFIMLCLLLALSPHCLAGDDKASIIALDFRKDGVKLLPSQVYFDILGNDIFNATDWVAPPDAFLVADLDGDGSITNGGELFSLPGQNAAYTLATLYDDDKDGRLTKSDAIWRDLHIWMDMNVDGLGQADELRPLSYLKVSAITLPKSMEKSADRGLALNYDFLWQGKRMKGLMRVMPLAYDPMNTMTPAKLKNRLDIPPLRGYGQMPALDAFIRDNNNPPDIVALLYSIANTPLNVIFDPRKETSQKVEGVMYEWAGLPVLEPYARGPNVNPYHISYLEMFTGQAFRQKGDMSAPLMISAYFLENAYLEAFKGTYARLLLWSDARTLFSGIPYYVPDTDTIQGAVTLNPARLVGVAQQAAFMPTPLLHRQYWANVLRFIDGAAGLDKLKQSDLQLLKDLIVQNTHNVTYEQVINQLNFVNIPIARGSVCADEVLPLNFSHDALDPLLQGLKSKLMFWKRAPALTCDSLLAAQQYLDYRGFNIRDVTGAFEGIPPDFGFDKVSHADRLSFMNGLKKSLGMPFRAENIYLYSKGDRIVYAYNYEYQPNIGPSDAEK